MLSGTLGTWRACLKCELSPVMYLLLGRSQNPGLNGPHSGHWGVEAGSRVPMLREIGTREQWGAGQGIRNFILVNMPADHASTTGSQGRMPQMRAPCAAPNAEAELTRRGAWCKGSATSPHHSARLGPTGV